MARSHKLISLVSSPETSFPRPALGKARGDGKGIAVIDVDVGASRSGFVGPVLVSNIDIQDKRKVIHFACVRDRHGNRSCVPVMRSDREIDGLKDESPTDHVDTIVFGHEHARMVESRQIALMDRKACRTPRQVERLDKN
jgi:hypothetical protein